jgi:hypothetical protein
MADLLIVNVMSKSRPVSRQTCSLDKWGIGKTALYRSFVLKARPIYKQSKLIILFFVTLQSIADIRIYYPPTCG